MCILFIKRIKYIRHMKILINRVKELSKYKHVAIQIKLIDRVNPWNFLFVLTRLEHLFVTRRLYIKSTLTRNNESVERFRVFVYRQRSYAWADGSKVRPAGITSDFRFYLHYRVTAIRGRQCRSLEETVARALPQPWPWTRSAQLHIRWSQYSIPFIILRYLGVIPD